MAPFRACDRPAAFLRTSLPRKRLTLCCVLPSRCHHLSVQHTVGVVPAHPTVPSAVVVTLSEFRVLVLGGWSCSLPGGLAYAVTGGYDAAGPSPSTLSPGAESTVTTTIARSAHLSSFDSVLVCDVPGVISALVCAAMEQAEDGDARSTPTCRAAVSSDGSSGRRHRLPPVYVTTAVLRDASLALVQMQRAAATRQITPLSAATLLAVARPPLVGLASTTTVPKAWKFAV